MKIKRTNVDIEKPQFDWMHLLSNAGIYKDTTSLATFISNGKTLVLWVDSDTFEVALGWGDRKFEKADQEVTFSNK